MMSSIIRGVGGEGEFPDETQSISIRCHAGKYKEKLVATQQMHVRNKYEGGIKEVIIP